jgi:hypothetical protein
MAWFTCCRSIILAPEATALREPSVFLDATDMLPSPTRMFLYVTPRIAKTPPETPIAHEFIGRSAFNTTPAPVSTETRRVGKRFTVAADPKLAADIHAYVRRGERG